jgi:hypothetical protein
MEHGLSGRFSVMLRSYKWQSQNANPECKSSDSHPQYFLNIKKEALSQEQGGTCQ